MTWIGACGRRKSGLCSMSRKASKHKTLLIGGMVIVLFLFYVYGPLGPLFTAYGGMGSVKPGCAKCVGQTIACNVDSDCPVTVDEVFYGEPVTLAAPRCEKDKLCGYDTAIKFSSGAIVCNFINCVPLLCKDECEWKTVSGDYFCYDKDGDLCTEKVWSEKAALPHVKYKGTQGYIKSVLVSNANVAPGEPVDITITFVADVEGQYMLGAGVVYPDKPLFAVLPGRIRRNYCDPSVTWYGKEMVHLYPGEMTVNFTVTPKPDQLGIFNVEGVWLKDCSTGMVDWTGYDMKQVQQWTQITVSKETISNTRAYKVY